MGMTIWRWSAGVALACAAIAAAVLPFPASIPERSPWAAPPPLVSEIRKLSAAAADAQAAVRGYRAAQALDRWTLAARNADTMLVRIDRSVPASVASAVRVAAARQWSALDTPVSAAHAEVFVYFDSTSIPRARDSSTVRRALEPRRLVDVTFALPPATDGQRCVALVRLRGSSPAHVGALQSQSLIGVCGFYAVFGLPGAGLEAWLTATGHRFAWRSDWSVARAPATDVSSLYTLSEAAGRCLTGDSTGCAGALQADAAPAPGPLPGGRVAWVLDAAGSNGPIIPARSLGDAQSRFLADVVRSIGAERFERFWRSPSRPPAAFLSASGTPLDTWTRQWLTRTYGARPSAPGARVGDVVWLAIAALLALAVAARPRQRVLAERLFGRHS